MYTQKINEIFRKNLSTYLAERGHTQLDLAKYMNVSNTTVNNWVKGYSAPRMDKIDRICRFLRITRSDLLEDKAASIPNDPNVFIPKLKRVPLLGTTAAGEPMLSDEDFEGYVGTTANADFCLHVNGDSMTGIGIYDGDIVFVKSQKEAESGQVVVVRINGDAVTLKRFYRNGASVILQSENPAYPPMIFNADNCDDFRILGIAIIKQSVIK